MGEWEAWDDVNGGNLPLHLVKKAMKEEVDFIEGSGNWILRPISEYWKRTGQAPISMTWVDTNIAWKLGDMEVRSRMVARHFKGGDKGRDDLFAETPPLEAKRFLLSKAATSRKDGKYRKSMFID
eukprot:2618243-Karenia_brevis.AAC.1